MRISVGAGTYVVAVSGGVDSMVLLDILQQRPGMKLVVAHFDHGIRPDSAEDRKLVQAKAREYGLPFIHQAAKLGPEASEATARTARYKFLDKVKQASNAKAIITAHHQDDLLETAIFNLMRGSGRRGLTALKNREGLLRPLLEYDKAQIRDYAEAHAVAWREDPTNTDASYTRNYIRANILPKFSAGQRAQLVILLSQLTDINQELDEHLEGLLHIQPALDTLDRAWFINLPHDVAKEIVHAWLRRHHVQNVTKKTIERLIVVMKTGRPGQRFDVDDKHSLWVKKNILALRDSER